MTNCRGTAPSEGTEILQGHYREILRDGQVAEALPRVRGLKFRYWQGLSSWSRKCRGVASSEGTEIRIGVSENDVLRMGYEH